MKIGVFKFSDTAQRGRFQQEFLEVRAHAFGSQKTMQAISQCHTDDRLRRQDARPDRADPTAEMRPDLLVMKDRQDLQDHLSDQSKLHINFIGPQFFQVFFTVLL